MRKRLDSIRRLDMSTLVPIINTYTLCRDGARRRCQQFEVGALQFRIMGYPSVDSVTFRLPKRPFLSDFAGMRARGFLPRRDRTTGKITGYYKTFELQPYTACNMGFRNVVSVEWYRSYGTYIDVKVKSLTYYRFQTSRKSFKNFDSYIHSLALLQVLYQKATGYWYGDRFFGFKAFEAQLARLDIAVNLQFKNKRDALNFMEACKSAKVPHLRFTLPEKLPRGLKNNFKGGKGFYFLNDEQCLAIYLKDEVDPKSKNTVRIENRFLSPRRLGAVVERLNSQLRLDLRPLAQDLFHSQVLQLLWWEKAKYLFDGATPVVRV